MAAQSSSVSPGNPATSKQYNDLRTDALNRTLGHRHTGASRDGKVIADVNRASEYLVAPIPGMLV